MRYGLKEILDLDEAGGFAVPAFNVYNLETVLGVMQAAEETGAPVIYGVHLTSFYLPGDHLPHVRVMETGYERAQEGLDFGLPYVLIRHPQPYDTTTLNYNWQIWDTETFSLYTPVTDSVNPATAQQAAEAILRFLRAKGLCRGEMPPIPQAQLVFREASLHNMLSNAGGLLLRQCAPGDAVEPGTVLADIVEPCSGQVLERLRSDCAGRVFFARRSLLIDGHEVAFRILPDGCGGTDA